MAWLRREDRETCRECFQEAIDQQIPALQRIHYVEQYPCRKHGHPGILSPKLTAWVEFFLVVQPYCTPQTLPIELVDKICKEYGIPFVKAFEQLTIILQAFTRPEQNDIRNQGNGIRGGSESHQA